MGASVDYLFKDPKTGRLSYRRVYSAELRPHVPGGSRELKRSLGATSITAPGARERYNAAASEYECAVAQARKVASGIFDTLDSPAIAYLAEAYAAERLSRDNEARWQDGEEKEAGYARKKRETLDGLLPHYRSLQGSGDLDQIEEIWADEVETFATAKGYRLDTDTPEFRQLCAAINRAAIRAGEAMLSRLDGNELETPPEPSPPLPIAKCPQRPESSPSDSFAAIAERLMAKPRHALSATTKEAYRTALRFWREVHGGIEPTAISRAKVAEWLDLLTRRPARLPAKERDLSLPKLVELYEGREAVPRLATVTVNQHLGSLATLWKKAQKDGDIPDGLPNPFKDHTVPNVRRQRVAKGFSPQELQAIFNLPVFTKGERPGRGKGEASYWLPLLLLWTGARPEEIAQLLVSDVFKAEGTGRWSLRISEEGSHPHKGARRLKTSEKDTGQREFPLPQPLLDLGFLRYVEWLRKNGHEALFPELRTKGSRKLLFAGFSEFWSAYLRSNGIPLASGRQPAREFRHTWTTAARACGIPEDARDFIQGHSRPNASANQSYGEKVPLGLRIDDLGFVGLDLSRLKPWEPAP
jgi:integrase